MRGERGNEKREQRGKRTKDVGVGGSIDRAAFVYLIIEPTKKMTAKVRQPVALAKLAWCPISCEKGTVPLADRLVIKTLINNPRD